MAKINLKDIDFILKSGEGLKVEVKEGANKPYKCKDGFFRELEEDSVIRNFRITAGDGKIYDTKHYNLDCIIALGYRVNSKRATQFRIWATQRLREYIIGSSANSVPIGSLRLNVAASKICFMMQETAKFIRRFPAKFILYFCISFFIVSHPIVFTD